MHVSYPVKCLKHMCPCGLSPELKASMPTVAQHQFGGGARQSAQAAVHGLGTIVLDAEPAAGRQQGQRVYATG